MLKHPKFIVSLSLDTMSASQSSQICKHFPSLLRWLRRTGSTCGGWSILTSRCTVTCVSACSSGCANRASAAHVSISQTPKSSGDSFKSSVRVIICSLSSRRLQVHRPRALRQQESGSVHSHLRQIQEGGWGTISLTSRSLRTKSCVNSRLL